MTTPFKQDLSINPDTFLPPEIQQEIEKLEKTFNTNAVLEFIDQLLAEAESDPIADRFSKTELAGKSLGGLPPGSNLTLKGLTEAEYKRMQLQMDLRHVRGRFLSAMSSIKVVILDLRMTQRNHPDTKTT